MLSMAMDRLDFTVMGPAVNRTARFESLTVTLGKPILFSKKFSHEIEQQTECLGEFQLKGIEAAQPIYSLLPDQY